MQAKHLRLGVAAVTFLAWMGHGVVAQVSEVTTQPAESTLRAVKAVPMADILPLAQRIDRMIEAGYAEQKIKPNPLVNHQGFLRRTYLGIVGRIPTFDEAVSFLRSGDPKKRSQLIDNLLDSEGYISHHFHFWADLLRVKTQLPRTPGQPYVAWIKESLRTNKPYDEFTRDLVTARGFTWENGAAGYYQRDFAMPLDNMSNTAQIFLGTRLVCAQCHDHPFDDWTQRDYYGMAAFTFGVQTARQTDDHEDNLRQFRKLLEREDRWTRTAGSQMVRHLDSAVVEHDRPLLLPEDYEYDDDVPGAVVHPKVIFGTPHEMRDFEHPRYAYAQWLTNPDNPRFTIVIANRLWRKVMGVGLIEPSDDIKQGVQDASNPKLLGYLAEVMVDLDYDMKQFLRVLYNTRTYQRQVSRDGWKPGTRYDFPGPALRRMSAEQIWDSLLTLAIANLDHRRGRVEQVDAKKLNEFRTADPLSMLAMAKARGARNKENADIRRQMGEVFTQIQTARKNKKLGRVNALQTKYQELAARIREPNRMDTMMMKPSSDNADGQWKHFSPDMVRASELPSPTAPGHFLRRFGQSNREVIENASTEATVPQILNMINGPLFSRLMNTDSQFVRDVNRENSRREKIDVIFMSILSRRPTPSEARMASQAVKVDSSAGYENVVWALMNTREFIFVQ